MKAIPIPIKWNSNLPIFASEPFLKAVSNKYGWLGGIDDSGKIRCILPYTIIHKTIFRLVRFRTETIPIDGNFDISEERSFLNSVVEYFRFMGSDIIIPASNNAIFRIFPDGADVAPYGSYIVDLSQPEENLWRNIGKIYRQNISRAKKDGVYIKTGLGELDIAYKLIHDTFRRSKIAFMNYASFKRFIFGLFENCQIMVAYYKGVAQGCTVYAFSNFCAYAVYGGSIEEVHQGAIKLIDWEAMCFFKQLGVRLFDFVGARINPEKGSKQDAINAYKRRMGGKLKKGYIWKYPLKIIGSITYSIAVKLFRGGDIVDAERHKMKNYNPIELEENYGKID